ncbi:MAG: hypothetical protein ACF8PN_07995 [Phycisphaerales bacterium]
MHTTTTTTVELPAAQLKKHATRLARSTMRGRGSYGVAAATWVRIDVDGATVRHTTTDLDVWQELELEHAVAYIDQPTSWVVPFKAWRDALKSAKGRGATIAYRPGAGILDVLSSSGATTTLQLENLADWPRRPDVTGGPAGDVDASAMLDVLPAASSDANRPVLCSVNVTADGTYAATDSYRLHAYTAPIPAGIDVTIPADLVDLVGRAGATGQIGYRSSTDGRYLELELPDGTAVGRTLEQAFPDFEKLFPVLEDLDYRIKLEDGTAAAAVLRETAPQLDELPARLELEPTSTMGDDLDAGRRVGIYNENASTGVTVRRMLPGARHAYPLGLELPAFNAAYLADLVDLEGPVTIAYATALKPAAVYVGRRRRLVMPVRV